MRVFTLCCLFSVFICLSVYAEEIVVVYAEKGYMPYYSSDATQGMYIDFLKEFNEEHPQYSFILKPYPRKRMTLMMQNGDVHVLSLNSPAFADTEKYLFTETIWKEACSIFMRADNLFSFKDPSDLFGKRLGIILGNEYPALTPYVQSGEIKFHIVASSVQLFNLLRIKRIDAFVGDRYVTLYRLKQEGFDEVFEYAQTALFEFELAIQVQKTHQHLVFVMNRFIEESKNNGFLDTLEEKYLKWD